MITDEERREVAAKLRKTLCIPGLPGEWWVRVHTAVTGSENCMCPPEDINVIADLIDRPTCRLKLTDNCPRCDLVFGVVHYEHDDTYITSWTEFETVPRYCPWCGEDLTIPDREMKPVLSPSVELLRPDGPTAKAMGAIMANVVAGFNSSLTPVLRGVAREVRAMETGKDIQP